MYVNGYEVEFYEGKDFTDRVAFDHEAQFRVALRHAAAPKRMHQKQFSERKRWERERIRAEQELQRILAPLVTDASAYRTVRNQTDSWLERWSTRAYEAGMAAAGLGDQELDNGADQYLRKNYIAEERQYMRAFLDGIRKGRVSAAMTRYRASLYAKSLDAAFNVGLLSSFPWSKATKIHWQLGHAEHCTGCVRLSRKVWTPMTLPTVPRAGNTPCKMNCKCTLVIHYDATVKLATTPTRGRGAPTATEQTVGPTIETDDLWLYQTGVEPDSPIGTMLMAGYPEARESSLGS